MYYNKRDLDNYITGHYGEDQFQGANETFDPYDEGGDARVQGLPKTANPYYEESDEYRQWNSGWDEEDFWLSRPAETEE